MRILWHSSTSAPWVSPCCSLLLLALLKSLTLTASNTNPRSLCLVDPSTQIPFSSFKLHSTKSLSSSPAHASVALAPAMGPSVRTPSVAAKAALPKLFPRSRATSTAFQTHTAPGSARQVSTPTAKNSGSWQKRDPRWSAKCTCRLAASSVSESGGCDAHPCRPAGIAELATSRSRLPMGRPNLPTNLHLE